MELKEQLNEQQNYCTKPSIDYIIVKLAARCNIACTYCYWFKDESVYAAPKRMTAATQEKFADRLRELLADYPPINLPLILHGGEPLLFGKKNFDYFCTLLRDRTADIDANVSFAITTNAMLIDADWVELFRKHEVAVSVSLDGNQEINDAQRVDFQGNGTYTRVIQGVNLLRAADICTSFLTVCNPQSDPRVLLEHFCNDLNITHFDVLVPEITHDVPYISIADYYINLFDQWIENYSQKGITIRILDSMMKVLLGKYSTIDSIGYGDVTSVTLYTDGQFGGSDEVNSTGNNLTYRNVFDHPLSSITTAKDWKEFLDASRNLHEKCNQCRYKMECGGGSLQTRWKSTSRFNNPSVYCEDYQKIFDHIAIKLVENIDTINPDL